MTGGRSRPTPAPVETSTVHRLLATGLLSSRSVLDGSLRVSRAAGRNVNLAVTTRGGPSYVVKYGRGDGGRHEAAAYRFLSTVASREVRAALPSIVMHTRDSMLVLERIEGPNLRSRHARLGRCPASWARRSGALLAAVHGLPTTAAPAILREVRVRPVHRPDELLFATSSRAGVELTALIQSDPALCAALDQQVAETTTDAFTHGDIRWDNILVDRDGRGRFAGLRLVDWESAGVGDPGWDVGCLLAEYVSHWIYSIPFTTAAATAADAALARVPLASAQTAISAAWTAYTTHAGAGGADGRTNLRRVIRHAAHRLLHRALELDGGSSEVSLAAACHVQVGARMLAEPDVAATTLLGIPAYGAADG